MKVSIVTSRPIGLRCLEWAKDKCELVPPEESDVLISVMYDKLITEDFINSHKCFNFHPGILPWYRGAGAYSWAIINGEMETGVTLHEIDRDIDHGKVIKIERFPITKDDTAGSLFKKAEDLIFKMFTENFESLLTGSYSTTEQIEGKIYYRKDLEKVKDLTKYIRAFTFKGKESAYYFDKMGNKIYIEYENH